MTWPFKQPDNTNPDSTNANPDPAKKDGDPPKEKTAAELIAEAIKPFQESIATLSSEVRTLRETSIQKPSKGDEGGGDPQPTVTSVLDDENAAFNQRLTPIVLRQLEVEARIVKNDIKQEYVASGFGDLWNQYAGDIDKTLEGSPVVGPDGKALRGSPDYIRNVVDMILGRAARKAGIRFDGQKKSFFLETAGGDPGTRQTTTPEDGLTEAQRKVFERMGVSAEDRKKTMAKLVFIK